MTTMRLAPSLNTKKKNRGGCCCSDLSCKTLGQGRGQRGSSKLISINEGTDLLESDKHDPPMKLPTVRSHCELVEMKKAVFHSSGDVLAGSTIDDISDLYLQLTTVSIMTIKEVRYIVFA